MTPRQPWAAWPAHPAEVPEVNQPDSENAWQALPDRLQGRADWLSERGRIKDADLMYAAACEIRELRRALKSAIAKATGAA